MNHSNTTYTAADLIRFAKENPPEPIIAGILNKGDILLVHGAEASFKTFFILELAFSLATGAPFLRQWPVTKPLKVGVVETEIHPGMLGQRLGRMVDGHEVPEHLRFLNDDGLHQFRNHRGLGQKVGYLKQWVIEQSIEVLLIDTANDFFRQSDDPNAEKSVGEFFDQIRNLRLPAVGLVRHNKKKRDNGFGGDCDHDNDQIRGSAEWKEDPEAIISLRRKDRRTNEVEMDIGKLRYGQPPEKPIPLWLDADHFRLLPIPPVLAVLENGPCSRQELLEQCSRRFGMSARTVDEKIGEIKPYLRENQQGHQKIFDLDHEKLQMDGSWPLLQPFLQSRAG